MRLPGPERRPKGDAARPAFAPRSNAAADRHPIPAKARIDSFHLATAAWHGMDYLVSWNCTHIASARVRRIVAGINDALDIRTPVICTPEELMEV